MPTIMMNEEIIEKKAKCRLHGGEKKFVRAGGGKLSIFRQEEWLLEYDAIDEDSGRTASVKNE